MINRRQFIKRAALGYGSLLLLPSCIQGIEKTHWRILNQDEAECLACMCEQFIPSDEYAGAREARVVNFIDKLLYQRFTHLQAPYKKGIKALESFCKATYAKPYAGLSWDEQYMILQRMERGELPESFWEEIPQKEFFNMVLRNTMQGYYGPPRHGGNKDYVSYRMMRLDFPLLIGQNRYEK